VDTMLALAPLLICPLMMLLIGGGIAGALGRLSRAPSHDRQT
jgi:hypothetical protein